MVDLKMIILVALFAVVYSIAYLVINSMVKKCRDSETNTYKVSNRQYKEIGITFLSATAINLIIVIVAALSYRYSFWMFIPMAIVCKIETKRIDNFYKDNKID